MAQKGHAYTTGPRCLYPVGDKTQIGSTPCWYDAACPTRRMSPIMLYLHLLKPRCMIRLMSLDGAGPLRKVSSTPKMSWAWMNTRCITTTVGTVTSPSSCLPSCSSMCCGYRHSRPKKTVAIPDDWIRFPFRKCVVWSSPYWLCHGISSPTSCTGLPGVADTSGVPSVVIIAAALTFMTLDSRL